MSKLRSSIRKDFHGRQRARGALFSPDLNSVGQADHFGTSFIQIGALLASEIEKMCQNSDCRIEKIPTVVHGPVGLPGALFSPDLNSVGQSDYYELFSIEIGAF